MTGNKNDPSEDGDDFDPDFLPGDDLEIESTDDVEAQGSKVQTAWQKIEHRRDMDWLRDQTADWDYWDDYLHVQ